MEMMENYLLYSVSVLLFSFEKTLCVRKNPSYFPLFFETVWILFSLHFKAQKNRQKTFIFCFCCPFFVSLFFSVNIFPIFSFITVVIVHFFLSYFCSSLFVFLSFFFLLFSPSLLFFLYLSVSLSHPLYLMFPYLFSIAVFLCIFFWTNSFFFSLFCSWSLCFHTSSSPFFCFFISVSVFFFKKIKNLYGQYEMCFFWTLPSSVFDLMFFPPCVGRIPWFVPCFYWFWAFLDIIVLDFLLSIFFLGLFEKLSFCFGQKISKNIIDSFQKLIFC